MHDAHSHIKSAPLGWSEEAFLDHGHSARGWACPERMLRSFVFNFPSCALLRKHLFAQRETGEPQAAAAIIIPTTARISKAVSSSPAPSPIASLPPLRSLSRTIGGRYSHIRWRSRRRLTQVRTKHRPLCLPDGASIPDPLSRRSSLTLSSPYKL